MNSLFKAITIPSSEREDTIVPFAKTQNEQQMICINGLEVIMHIGVPDSERATAQRVIFNIKAEVTSAPNWRADDVDDVVSYVDVIETIEQIAETHKDIKLVETLAEMILEQSFQNPQIRSMKIEIQKPDIISNVQSVGVEFYRER